MWSPAAPPKIQIAAPIFLLAGPLIGHFIYFIFVAKKILGGFVVGLMLLASGHVLTLTLIYAFGLIPALCSMIAFGIARRWNRMDLYIIVAGAAGFIGAQLLRRDHYLAPTSAVTGVICAIIVTWLSHRQESQSTVHNRD
jgi:hypothetical protein